MHWARPSTLSADNPFLTTSWLTITTITATKRFFQKISSIRNVTNPIQKKTYQTLLLYGIRTIILVRKYKMASISRIEETYSMLSAVGTSCCTMSCFSYNVNSFWMVRTKSYVALSLFTVPFYPSLLNCFFPKIIVWCQIVNFNFHAKLSGSQIERERQGQRQRH